MTDTQTIEAINRHLDECPTDWTSRLELADLLEEIGEEERARYQRWAVKWERSPIVWRKRASWRKPWHWWGDNYRNGEDCIGMLVNYLDGYSPGYNTRQQGEDELMQALILKGWPDLPEVA